MAYCLSIWVLSRRKNFGVKELNGRLISQRVFLFITVIQFFGISYSQPTIKIENFYPAVDTGGITLKPLLEEYYVLESDTNIKHGSYKKFSRFDKNIILQ